MNSSQFAEKIKFGNSVVKRIEKSCESQDLVLENILYNYFSLFRDATTKVEMKIILEDIDHYNPRDNLLIKPQNIIHHDRIKKEITPIIIEEGQIYCPKCKGNRVLRTQAQTRSSDEGTTLYLVCVNPEKPSCRHKWRVN